MPISQKTILAIYGDLCDVVEAIERLRQAALQGDLFLADAEARARVETLVQEAYRVAYDAQRAAIEHMIADEPAIAVHPLTGRLK